MRRYQPHWVLLLMVGWSMFLCTVTYLWCSGLPSSQDNVDTQIRPWTETSGNSDRESQRLKSVTHTISQRGIQRENLPVILRTVNSKNDCIPSVQHEVSRRRVESVMIEFWDYIQHELTSLKDFTSDMDTAKMIENIQANTASFKSLLSEDFKSLSKFSTSDTMDWRYNKAKELVQLVQSRIHQLQNPADCPGSRMLFCHWDTVCQGGFGCQIHHVTYCLMMAYATNRTLVLNTTGTAYSPWPHLFKPLSDTCHTIGNRNVMEWGKKNPSLLASAPVLSIPRLEFLNPRSRLVPLTLPSDLADLIHQFHGFAPVWWVGQFVQYVMRPQPVLYEKLHKHRQDIGFSQPIVGVHVRRTDKVDVEAKYHSLDEYIQHVGDWFSSQPQLHRTGHQKVYLATDDPAVIKEAKKRFPNYTFLHNERAAYMSHDPRERLREDVMLGVIQDIWLLAQCSHVVCTLTSNVCRAAYELMQPKHSDASKFVTSLDNTYFFEAAKRDRTIITTRDNHLPIHHEEIALQTNDSLFIFNNYGNGYTYGRNLRTRKTGVFPSYKVMNYFHSEPMPTQGDPT